MLHEKDPVETNRHIAELLPALLKTISDSADEVHFTQSSCFETCIYIDTVKPQVVLINLQVLARISLDEVQFNRVLNALVQLFVEVS